jgi:hypothetical protein
VLNFMGWFVQHPERILALGAVYVLAFAAMRAGPARDRAGALLVPALYCAFFAAWEWLVLVRTPDADIRVDLLLIWPGLLILTAWSIWRIFRR